MFLVFGPFYVLFLLAGWIALGLAWAPFAAFISMRKARRFGLNPLKFAALAFLLSLFFIFPWLYLNDALNGTKPNELRKSLADRVEPCSLFVLYATWLLGPIALMGVLIMVTASPPPSFVDDQTSGPLAPVLLTVFLLMWVGSLMHFTTREPGHRKQANLVYLAPDYIRIMPYVYAFVCFVVAYVCLPLL